MRAKLEASPLIPSLVVETKRGYQAYWSAQPGAKPEHWNALVLERLVPAFGADKNARDLCRILRAPGYWHLKDPADPFLCKSVWKHRVFYTERMIAEAFPWQANEQHRREVHAEARREHTKATGVDSGEDFWQAVYEIDCEEGLRRLSGSGAVGGESYSFRRAGNGNLNIFVDGKGTSCFVDGSKRIGSLSGGGPTLYNWLRWFGNRPADCVSLLKYLFPNLAQIDERNRKQRVAS
jgi:hypothetical protein